MAPYKLTQPIRHTVPAGADRLVIEPALEIVGELAHGAVALLRGLLECLCDDVVQVTTQLAKQLSVVAYRRAWGGHFCSDNGRLECRSRLPFEAIRSSASQQLKQYDSEGVHIARHRNALAADLLRRRRSPGLAGERRFLSATVLQELGGTEIE